MLDYGTLETELVDKINNYLSANTLATFMEARPMPDNEAEINLVMRDSITKTICLIAYNGSSYMPTQSIAAVSQFETVLMRVIFMGPKTRGTDGVFAMIKHVKAALTGWQPGNCSKRLEIKNYDLAEFQHFGVQAYLDFETETLNVQVNEADEELAPHLTKISYIPAAGI